MSFKLFKSLLLKSSHLQREIEQEQKQKWPDRFRLIRLKKIRLSIKDRMLRLLHNSVSIPKNQGLRFSPVKTGK
jgi:hypothetical protein